MTSTYAQLLKMKKILAEKGELAKKNTLQEMLVRFKDNSQISQAIRYFFNGALRRSLPVFPALMSISCEAVGGKSETVVAFSEAIILLTGAADLHDDVIDQSLCKNSKKTVLGKFGSNITILAGDAMLIEGIVKLSKEAQLIDKKQGEAVVELVTSAIFEISKAETLEHKLRSKGFNIRPSEYQKIIKQKAVVPELAMRIGATLGNGESESIEIFGRFGKSYGYLTTVLDEFIDVLDCNELTNRLKNEIPPLPIVYLLRNLKNRQTIMQLLRADLSNENTHQQLINSVKNSVEVQRFLKTLNLLINGDLQKMKEITEGKIQEELETLLLAPLAYLADLYPLVPTSTSN
jgi:geranylgeranyl pyrophosphate synthase